MTSWIMVALLGGFVGLDTTSFPQAMFSRPLVAGALTGAIFGRPTEGLIVGFIMEAYSLLVLPIGASRYPESGTATVAAASAYVVTTPGAFEPGTLAMVVGFALAWEWLGGGTVVVLRRTNGRILRAGVGTTARELERGHVAAMALDFIRGGVVAVTGGLIAAGLLRLAAPVWALGPGTTMAALAVLTAAMIGTAVPLFGGVQARRVTLVIGLGVGFILAAVLP
ncbi:MAG: PTS sugar transporter subunit IIC [Longimicrobiales bacterium]